MNVYAPGLVLTLTIPLVDEQGEMITPTALRYRILDEAAAEVLTWQVLTFTGQDVVATVTTTVVDNTLPVGAVQGFRRVELEITFAGRLIYGYEDYILEAKNMVVAGENSLQTYEQALLVSRTLGSLSAWDRATDLQRKSALMLAYTQLASFKYVIYYADDTVAQDDILNLSGAELALMDPVQLAIFRKAQIVQADFNLGGSPTEKAIADGLQSTTIGEVSQFFRPRASLVMPVCRQALILIGQYISWQPTIGRA